MNDETLEGLLRTRLHATAPADVPSTLVLAAAAIPEDRVRRGRRSTSRPRPVLSLRLGLAFALVVAVGLVATGLLVRGLGNGSVAGPTIPTLPPVTQPSLPPGAANPTKIIDGAWVSANVAWLVDETNALRVTEDGGLTWSEARTLPKADLRGHPTFLDASFGYTMWADSDVSPAQAVLVLTRDGGRTWAFTPVGTLPDTKADTNSLTAHFVDETHGIVLGGLYVQDPAPSGQPLNGPRPVACAGWSTDDGGRTWQVLPNAPCSNHDLWASGRVGIIYASVGGGPSVATTSDGGRTWRQGLLPGVTTDEYAWPAVVTVAPDGAPRIGYYPFTVPIPPGTPRTLIEVETQDGGATWKELYRAPATGLGAISVLGPDLWISSEVGTPDPRPMPREILESADGGRTWVTVGSLGTIDASASWIDRLHGMALDSANHLYLTNDGGATWQGVPF